LIDVGTGEPLIGTRVILCPVRGEELVCVIDTDLTAVTDDKGQFSITVAPGKYVLLYNSSGESQSGWDGLELDYRAPTSLEALEGVTTLHILVRSIGGDDVSGCFTQLFSSEGLRISGYVYSEPPDLAFVLYWNEPVSVTVEDGVGQIDLLVWDTVSEVSCEDFDPFQ